MKSLYVLLLGALLMGCSPAEKPVQWPNTTPEKSYTSEQLSRSDYVDTVVYLVTDMSGPFGDMMDALTDMANGEVPYEKLQMQANFLEMSMEPFTVITPPQALQKAHRRFVDKGLVALGEAISESLDMVDSKGGQDADRHNRISAALNIYTEELRIFNEALQ